jgi:hypothetical protein
VAALTNAQQVAPVFPQATLPRHAPARSSSTTWLDRYCNRLLLTDTGAVVIGVAAAQLIRFGVSGDVPLADRTFISYTLVSAVLTLVWCLVLPMFRSREPRIVGTGVEEYRRVAHASLALFGSVAIIAYLLKLDIARGYLVVALPFGLLLLLGSRRAWREWLLRQRAADKCFSSVLVVGSHRAAVAMAETFERDPSAGYRVVGVCEPGWPDVGRVLDIDGHRVPVLGDGHDIGQAIERSGADTVAVSNTEFLGADGMRALAWELEATQTSLVVSSGVVDVAGPRLHIRPVAGLPLLHVDKPQYQGASRFRKLAFDVAGAASALLLLSPLMLLIALAIKVTSRGPVFYRAERIGLNGKPFPMLKFRSMMVGADCSR